MANKKSRSSTRRKNKQQETAKSFAEQKHNHEIEKRRERVKKLPLWRKVLGIVLIHLMFSLWFIDRVLHLYIFWGTHPSFKRWLLDEKSLIMTGMRIIIFGLPTLFILLWIW
jgi:hypothetical protein